MIEYVRTLLLVSLVVIFATTAYAYETPYGKYVGGASFDSSENMLRIPGVKIDDRYVANARLKLDTNGQFIIEDFIELSDDERTVLEKIDSMPCGPADILGKLTARNAFVNGESYCLMRAPGFTIEGGNVFDYLLIENGAAYLVFDIRDDPFGGPCCFNILPTITQVRFGFLQDGAFIEQTTADQIDFLREYILQLIGDNLVEF